MSDLEFSDSEDEQNGNNNEINQLFEQATAHVQHIHQQITQNDLLHLYAHYKQATVGKCNTVKPNIFQMQARSKWQAWEELGEMSQEQAKEQYVQKLQQLDPIWYEDSLQNARNNAGKVGWVVHSTLQSANAEVAVKDDREKTAFDWVREGNLEKFKDYFAAHEQHKAGLLQELDEHGMGLLHWATDGNQAKILAYLLSAGSDVNLRDNEQQTALHYAASCGHRECMEMLLQYGADCHAVDADAQSCLDVAENDEIRTILQKYI